jgi:hypothetical protein
MLTLTLHTTRLAEWLCDRRWSTPPPLAAASAGFEPPTGFDRRWLYPA